MTGLLKRRAHTEALASALEAIAERMLEQSGVGPIGRRQRAVGLALLAMDDRLAEKFASIDEAIADWITMLSPNVRQRSWGKCPTCGHTHHRH